MTPTPESLGSALDLLYPDKQKRFVRELLLVFFGNTVVALFMMVVARNDSLAPSFAYAQCIGLSIYLIARLMCWWREGKIDLVEPVVAIPVGGIIGYALGTWSLGLSVIDEVENNFISVAYAIVSTLVFGAVGFYHFYALARISEAEARIRGEQLRRKEQEAQTAQAELRMLQAQIEPHFLFNTLANVVGLIDKKPDIARAMLLDLTTLLRTALVRTRSEHTALADELDLLRAYLGIMGKRMGKRLSWRIDAEPEIAALLLPPLLLQPLVENAIHHGLETKPGGGELAIACRRVDGHLEISVADNGLGLSGALSTANSGVGLSNVRARLLSRYGEAACLELNENSGGGVIARLSIPLEQACAS